MFAEINCINSYLFITLVQPRRASRDAMDLMFPPVRAGCCVALQLVALRCFMRDDLLAILAIFVLRVGGAIATPAVAAFFAAVASAIVPSPAVWAARILVIWAA